jgi:hypothetical protein
VLVGPFRDRTAETFPATSGHRETIYTVAHESARTNMGTFPQLTGAVRDENGGEALARTANEETTCTRS